MFVIISNVTSQCFENKAVTAVVIPLYVGVDIFSQSLHNIMAHMNVFYHMKE